MSQDIKKKFYLYIDDSGSRFPDREDSECRHDGMDHFALGGILVAEEDKDALKDAYKEFCTNWSINYPLHSTKIRGMRSDFAWLEESTKQSNKFYSELDDFLISLQVIGFATVVHRPGYNVRYHEKYEGKPWWMCKTAYSILIERVSKYVIEQNGILTVRFEGAGKREDRALIEYARDLKVTGMPFDTGTSAKYDVLQPADFQTLILGDPRRKLKENLFVQLADLYLYPMAKRKYEPTYNPWILLYENSKVIDALLPEQEWSSKGIKYSCFDGFDLADSKKPGKNPD